MHRINLLRPIILISIFFSILFSYAIFAEHNHRMQFDTYKALNKDWNYNSTLIDLPSDFSLKANEVARIEKVLPADFESHKTILLRASLQNMNVYLDGVLIFSHDFEEVGNMNVYASLWHMVEIPEDSQNKTLTIEISTPYESMSGRFNPVYYGNEASLNTYVLRTFGLRALIGILVFLMSFTILILNIVIFKRIHEATALFGAFGLLLSMWILAESKMLQYLTGNSIILGSLAYLALALMPVTLAFYARSVLPKRYYRFYYVVGILYFIQFIIINILHVTGIADFFESVIVSQLSMGIGILVTMGIMIYDYIKYKSNYIKKVYAILLFVLIIGILEFINFLSGNFDLTSAYAVFGIAFLMGLFLFQTVKDSSKRLKLAFEKEMYQKLAFNDALTGSLNRLAYEQDVESMYKQDNVSDLTLVYFDFDNLKKINDTYGHLEGDHIIIDGYKHLNNFFEQYGKIYRVGGDEFIYLGLNGKDKIVALLEKFDAYIMGVNKTRKIDISISYGVACYNETSTPNPKDLMRKADYAMYDYKKSKKDIHHD